MKNKKNAFTLVELLAVIVVLAIILVIAVPKVMSIINDSKKATFEASARQILQYAENQYIENKTMGIDEKITCNDIAKINKTDYEICKIEFINDVARLTIKGSGKFEGLYICKNKKNAVEAVSECNIDKTSIELTIQKNDGTEDIIETYEEGSIIDLEILTREGYIFEGWEVVKGNSTITDNKLTIGIEDTIVYAKWKRNTLVTIDYDNGEENYSTRHVTNTTINLEIPTKENYKFVRWELVSGNSMLSGSTLTIGTEDTIVKAIWELNVFNLSINLDGGSVSENQEGIYQVGETITLVSPIKENYKFVKWELVRGNSVLSGNSLTIGTEDTVVKAIYTPIEYAISYNLDGGNATNKTSYTIETETFTLNNPSKIGYTFTGWTGSNGNEPSTNVTIEKGTTGNKEYTANYNVNTYQINYELDGGTLGENSPTEGEFGSTIELLNPTRTGYLFERWVVNEGALLSGNILTIGARDVTLTAKWILINPVESYYCTNSSVGTEPYLFTYTGDCEVIDDGDGNWRMRLLSDGDFTTNVDLRIDTFLVGGGGGGGRSSSEYSGGGGGGGGFVINDSVNIVKNNEYEIVIGAGGNPMSKGNNTTAFNLVAEGGNPGNSVTGGNGGSGGAPGGYSNGTAASGGSNGENARGSSGIGKGMSTYEFGDSTLTLYAGGGGGGAGKSNPDYGSLLGTAGLGGSGGGANGGCGGTGKTALPNTGGGGGGGSPHNTSGGSGGSGIVVIRNTRDKCSSEYIPNNEFEFIYTGKCQIITDGSDNWKIKFLTSGIFTVNTDMEIDAFLVGGGGGGGISSTDYAGGGGGGGGYTKNKFLSINKNTPYEIVIGDGGIPSIKGENTTAFNIIAEGGSAGNGVYGGSGGSGGGSGSWSYSAAGAGGTNGANGGASWGSGGTGQIVTTYEFENPTLTLYSGGGGGGAGRSNSDNGNILGTAGIGGAGGGANGGHGSTGKSALQNTGAGGGGGSVRGVSGGYGGSGIVVIRKPIYGCINGNIDFKFRYSGECNVIDDENGNWRIKFLTSGTFIPYEDISVDAFLVGGGGGGGVSSTEYAGGGGGGGGLVNSAVVDLAKLQYYEITIGYGGKSATKGESTTAFDIIAEGGSAGNGVYGGSGGSGGGGGSWSSQPAGHGGTNGGSGIRNSGYTVGTGQTTTTYEFGDSTLTLYSGGGGGGAGRSNSDNGNILGTAGTGGAGGGANGGYGSTGKTALPNTGGGGGGGSPHNASGGSGGSGIVVIRKAK